MTRLTGWRRSRSLVLILAIVGAVWSCHSTKPVDVAPTGQTAIRIITRWTLPDTLFFDFISVDPDMGRLYVTRSNLLQVVDIHTGSIVGRIDSIPGIHEVVLPPNSHYGFATSAGDTAVVVFDRVTLHHVATVRTGGVGPDAIAYEPRSGRVVAFNGPSKNATVIDVARPHQIGTIDLGGYGESAAADNTGRLFVNLKDRDEIAVIDPSNLTVQAHWPIEGCDYPHAMSYDPTQHTLMIGCAAGLAVISAQTGKVLSTTPLSGIADENAFDTHTGVLFHPCGADNDSLCVIQTRGHEGVQVLQRIRIPTSHAAQFVAFDRGTRQLFVPVIEKDPPSTGASDAERRHIRIVVLTP